MVEEAEQEGKIRPGFTLIEPTSGNTGIGLSLVSAVKGYKCTISAPDKTSHEKIGLMRALGSNVVISPTRVSWDSPISYINVAKRLRESTKDSYILDQYSNSGNINAHKDITAEELYFQTDGKIDYLVVGAGTGGTITGLAMKLKELIPDIKIIGVDPVGSILAQPESLNVADSHFYLVEGIGYDFIPPVLNRDLVDKWIKVNDRESFSMADRLIKEEGLLCGGTSGSAMFAAMKLAKTLPVDAIVVVVLPDSSRNYLDKFLSNKWMTRMGLLKYPNPHESESETGHATSTESNETKWYEKTIRELKLHRPLVVEPNTKIEDLLALMVNHKDREGPILVVKGYVNVVGILYIRAIYSSLMRKKCKLDDPIGSIMQTKFPQIDISETLGKLDGIFEYEKYAVVTWKRKCYLSGFEAEVTDILCGIAKQSDLLMYLYC